MNTFIDAHQPVYRTSEKHPAARHKVSAEAQTFFSSPLSMQTKTALGESLLHRTVAESPMPGTPAQKTSWETSATLNAPVQRESLNEEDLLQGKFEAAQRLGPDEEEPLQSKSAVTQRTAPLSATQSLEQRMADPQSNGLPWQLKSGIEVLSGFSMDDVRVHRNSPKPAQLHAHAYTQGSDIHLAPGQDTHLPHEAWHVVQQKQNRVHPTIQMQGVSINDDAGLEREADVLGERAAQTRVHPERQKPTEYAQQNKTIQKRPATPHTIPAHSLKLTHGTSVDDFLVDKADPTKGSKPTPDAPAWLAEEPQQGEEFSVHVALVMQGYGAMVAGDTRPLTVHVYEPEKQIDLAQWENWYQAAHYVLEQEGKPFSGSTAIDLPGWTVNDDEKKAAKYAKDADAKMTWNTREAATRLFPTITGNDGYRLEKDLVKKLPEDILSDGGLQKLLKTEKREFNVTCTTAMGPPQINTLTVTSASGGNTYEVQVEVVPPKRRFLNATFQKK